MSYDSNFRFEGINENIAKQINDKSNYKPYKVDGQYAVTDASWYEHRDDLLYVSHHNPTTLITVTIYGEDDGDIKREYYLNGQVQEVTPTITFPPCTLPVPTVFHSKVTVKILGEPITIEVEHVGTKSQEQLSAMALDLIRKSL